MQVYFENPFCSLFALAIDVAKILLAALNARLASDCLFERKMVCVPRPRAPCEI